MKSGIVIVKVGGSLLDLPDLAKRIRGFLVQFRTSTTILMIGGGPSTDLIREAQHTHDFDDSTAHWLAIRALTLNGHMIASILSGSRVVASVTECEACWEQSVTPILDPFPFMEGDEASPDRLPHSWNVTSDSIAARVAVVWKAEELILLKSCAPPPSQPWAEWAKRGYVDPSFPKLADRIPSVKAIDFRGMA